MPTGRAAEPATDAESPSVPADEPWTSLIEFWAKGFGLLVVLVPVIGATSRYFAIALDPSVAPLGSVLLTTVSPISLAVRGAFVLLLPATTIPLLFFWISSAASLLSRDAWVARETADLESSLDHQSSTLERERDHRVSQLLRGHADPSEARLALDHIAQLSGEFEASRDRVRHLREDYEAHKKATRRWFRPSGYLVLMIAFNFVPPTVIGVFADGFPITLLTLYIIALAAAIFLVRVWRGAPLRLRSQWPTVLLVVLASVIAPAAVYHPPIADLRLDLAKTQLPDGRYLMWGSDEIHTYIQSCVSPGLGVQEVPTDALASVSYTPIQHSIAPSLIARLQGASDPMWRSASDCR